MTVPGPWHLPGVWLRVSVVTGTCRSTTLSNGEQSTLCQGLGTFQESGFITCTHGTPANLSPSDREQSAMCQGRGCFQESGFLNPCSRAPAKAPPSPMESRAPCARAVAASRSLAPRTRTHTTPANAPSSDGEQCALCEGRGCFQESAPTRTHGPLPKRHPLRWRAERHAPGPWRLPGIWLHYLYSRDPCQCAILSDGEREPCARVLAPSRSLASLPVLTGPLPTCHPPIESRAPCARAVAVAASRSLASSTRAQGPLPTRNPLRWRAERHATGPWRLPGIWLHYLYSQDPCQSAILYDGEQSAMRQCRGCFQEPGSPYPYSQDPCQRAIL
ncbi:hypothetical protein NDU88_006844 [Pleurodeles waltl]|uniref:Uncharacterized protein n=1 Tax=Pleurodeles waltl TaxID=8319 RepID=A0AAV7LTN7_PLEWA|nr:hypothetical protein NDU88_006844 [Pleurodeles waltl]